MTNHASAGADSRRRALQASYDRVADEYVARIAGELAHKPLDCCLLDRFGGSVAPGGLVGDLGCGPGHVTRYLHDRGLSVLGVDLSPALVSWARALHPGVPFVVGDFRQLAAPDHAWAGIVAFYSLIHVPRADIESVLREFGRVLAPGGPLLVAFHIGHGEQHLTDWWGHPVSLAFVRFEPAEMALYLRRAGFVVTEVVERDPYPEVEVPTRRAYLRAVSKA